MKKTYVLVRAEILGIIQIFITFSLFTILMLLQERQEINSIILKTAIVENLIFILIFYYKVIQPIKKMNRVFRVFAEGYTIQDIFIQRYELNAAHDSMIQRMNQILDRKKILEISKKQAEYLALQNQINPHFLYNTLEGIRSEALIGGMDSVAEMAEALAKFFRYTISNLKTMVTVEDELNNVRNYCLIQQFRFGDKIQLKIEYEEEDETSISTCKMPKLILQPIVENAIRHGIEPLIGQGLITIRLQIISKKLHIFISDNGIGMDNDTLLKLNKQLKGTFFAIEEADKIGGIAMVNVNNRIRLIFGDEYGIHFYSTPQLGTDVEILLPAESRMLKEE